MDKDIDYLTLKLKYNDLKKDYDELKEYFKNQKFIDMHHKEMYELKISTLKNKLIKSEKKLKRAKEQKFYQFRLAAKWAYENSELKMEIDDLKQKLTDALKDFDDMQKENDKLACQLKQENLTSNDTCQHYEHQIVELDKEVYKLQQREKFLEQQVSEKEKEIQYQESMKILAVKNKNQTAIAELEKVKEFCEQNYDTCDDIETGLYRGKVVGLDCVMYMGDMSLYDYIDQQIKELEGNEQC